jgi:hypothetical protein
MKHLQRSPQYATVLRTIAKDSPVVARSMTRMSDCVSAALEILKDQLGTSASSNPQLVLTIALELFRDSSQTGDKDGQDVLDPTTLF